MKIASCLKSANIFNILSYVIKITDNNFLYIKTILK